MKLNNYKIHALLRNLYTDRFRFTENSPSFKDWCYAQGYAIKPVETEKVLVHRHNDSFGNEHLVEIYTFDNTVQDAIAIGDFNDVLNWCIQHDIDFQYKIITRPIKQEGNGKDERFIHGVDRAESE